MDDWANPSLSANFGQKLKSLHKQKKLFQVKLADRLGVHLTYISSLERGLRNSSLKVINRIAFALEINREILIKF
ncbi:MAG: XRE family transcriptional regulator [Candidatus Nealsonbacteria bacterium CG08_land_8_20_14_0_20_38_20]|uniref:XRE family transcriptional regulator n=1 Tax=Candidatus Nealsonbacteria bacterium CG08_land_8_20_14_0_20_38_20 TaxID=1974705 RepID=A0A2H0YLD2_9BACT|nr:MAG: XRE family transcriptional regulator [Candidatus Nealsonbacteria bacterium CG08_land_8_20_14_0_20_38_20]